MNEAVKDIQWIVLYGLFNSIYLQYVCEHTHTVHKYITFLISIFLITLLLCDNYYM